MASFQSKIHRRPRKRENENYCSNPFLHDPWLKFQKNSNKIGWKMLEKAEKERKKNNLSFRFVLTRSVIENSKKIAKKFKKLKNTIMASFQAKIGWGR